MHHSKRIALVMLTRLEENISILKGIAAYERIHADWEFFLDDQAMSVQDPNWLFRNQWDGIICRHLIPTVLLEAARRGIPCVDLEDIPRVIPGIPKVRPDNRAVGHAGAEHFIDRGFKNLAFCGFDSEDWATERRAGFAEAVSLVGLDCFIHETTYSNQLTPGWDLDEQALIRAWIQQIPKPAGIMACNDMRALQVISAIHDLEIRVPEEIAVLGANNESVRAELSHPPLSSVPLNTTEWGFNGARLLHALLEGREADPLIYIEPLQVAVRRSTDALAIEDASIVKALEIIAHEACSNIRVEDIAHRLNVSRSLLERRFRKYLRRTPQDEIRQTKIRRAKDYLIETDRTLADIAELTGFEHPEYLSVMFKRIVGENPRDFRQRNRVS